VKEGGWLKDILGDFKQVRYWKKIFQRVADGKIDSWAYQWVFSCWVNSMLTILPNVNLVSNIGFGPGSTHNSRAIRFANIPGENLSFPLRHPNVMIRNEKMDLITAYDIFNPSKVGQGLAELRHLLKFPGWFAKKEGIIHLTHAILRKGKR